MAARPKREVKPFANVVQDLPAATGIQTEPIVNLAATRDFTDSAGVNWHRRGDSIDAKRVQRLLHDPRVQVVHDLHGDVNEVAGEQRVAFWEAAESSMRASRHSQFIAAEFKNTEGERLLVIHEDC